MPYDKGRIFRCHALLAVDQAYHHVIVDLVFIGGAPVAVIRWEDGPSNTRRLAEFVRLDPLRLSEYRDGAVNYVYDGLLDPIERAP